MLPGMSAASLLATNNRPLVPEVSYIGEVTGDASTPQTFTSVPVGSPHSKRIVAVVIFTRPTSASAVTGVTIGGVSATLLQGSYSQVNTCLAWASVPSGSTADVVVSGGNSVSSKKIAVWRVLAENSVPADMDSVESANPSITLTGSAVAVFAAVSNSNGSDVTSYTNAVQDAENRSASNRVQFAGRVSNPASLFRANTASITTLMGVGWS